MLAALIIARSENTGGAVSAVAVTAVKLIVVPHYGLLTLSWSST